MRGFGPLSELTQDMSPADRAEVERTKADIRREGERLAGRGGGEPEAHRPASGPQERNTAGTGRHRTPQRGR